MVAPGFRSGVGRAKVLEGKLIYLKEKTRY